MYNKEFLKAIFFIMIVIGFFTLGLSTENTTGPELSTEEIFSPPTSNELGPFTDGSIEDRQEIDNLLSELSKKGHYVCFGKSRDLDSMEKEAKIKKKPIKHFLIVYQEGDKIKFRSSEGEKYNEEIGQALLAASNNLGVDGKYQMKYVAEGLAKVLGGVELGVKSMFKKKQEPTVLTYEECKTGLQQRKKDLEIPNKLCYWEAMTEVYDEKCDNLNKQDISKIFQKKAQYRQLNNPDWPTLNTDGDFCVPVIYDCDEWLERKGDKATSTGGFLTPDGKFLFVNPFLANNQIDVLLHEGLHSIQDINYRGKLIFSDGFFEAFPEHIHVATKAENLRKQLIFKYKNILDKANIDYLEDKSSLVSSFDVESFSTDDLNELDKKYQTATDFIKSLYIDKLLSTSHRFVSVATIDFNVIPKNSYYYSYFSERSDFYGIIQEVKSLAHSDEFWAYFQDSSDYYYLSQLIELDPRLSEVHRWWFDQTAPNCRVLDTPSKFGEALQQFLDEKNLDEDYKKTQEQLNDVLTMAKKMNKREQIWNKLIGRGPGLAMLDNNQEFIYT